MNEPDGSRIGNPVTEFDVDLDLARELFQSEVDHINDLKRDIEQGGGKQRQQKQHDKGRLTARERIDQLLDDPDSFIEYGKLVSHEDPDEFPAAGVVTGIGTVSKRSVAVVAHDATVKAGSHIENTCRKTLRMQKLTQRLNIPIVYLVDSSGIFLPRQTEVFANEGHFGSIFYQNSRLSADQVPQFAAIMGPCVAGGAYLPALCDEIFMVDGAHLFIAGPGLVKAAIGQDVDADELGGVDVHEQISGTVDHQFDTDEHCLEALKNRLSDLPQRSTYLDTADPGAPEFDSRELCGFISDEHELEYDAREVIARLIDHSEFDEFRPDYGTSLLCGDATIQGVPVGIVCNQNQRTRFQGEVRVGGVIYPEGAEKAARYIKRSAQHKRPLLFIQDVSGFMVGKQAERDGIIKQGAEMVHAVSNAEVPKVTLVAGRSNGAGNYAMCGRAFKPDYMVAWPRAEIGVMGGTQATETLFSLKEDPESMSEDDIEQEKQALREEYEETMNPLHAANEYWVDDIIDPAVTPAVIGQILQHLLSMREPESRFGNT